MDSALHTAGLVLVFGVLPLLGIYYAFKNDGCRGIMALFVYGLLCLFAYSIMFIMGSSMANAVAQKAAEDKANPSARPTTEDVKLAAIRREALASSGA